MSVLATTGGDLESLVSQVTDEFVERLRKGESPDPEEYVARHPHLADVLRGLLPALAALNEPAGPDGQPLGDFRLLREVGRGGMGVVYEAEQLSLNRRVALKVLPFAATMDPRQLQRFHNEARAAASLEHPHIVPVFGVGCDRGVHYYAMKFIDGVTLAEVISGRAGGVNPPVNPATADWNPNQGVNTPRPPEPTARALDTVPARRDRAYFRRCAELIADAADAVEHAHSTGVVHRDVKPGNLMLDAAGKIWVTDFGLAKLGADAGLTMTGDLLGTLRYMAPEQALAKHGLVDHRADVYGLGATLYELLTGRPAVGGADKEAVLNRIAFDEPTPLRKLNTSIPPELETITLKCMAKEPAGRYATAKELADDLRRFLDTKPIKARPPGLRGRLGKWARRHPALVTATLAVLVLAVAALAVSNVLVGRARRDAVAAAEVANRRRADALRVVDEIWVGIIEKWLRDAPALEQTQRDFAQKVLEFYERMAQEEAGNPELQAEVGKAHYRLAAIHDRLGNMDQSTAAYTQAAGLFRRLAEQDPRNAEYRYWHAHSLAEHAELLDRIGKSKEAEAICQRAFDLFEKAAGDVPDDLRMRAGLANCCLLLGTVNYLPYTRIPAFYHPDEAPERGWKECVGLLRRALDLYVQLIRNQPGTSEHRLRFCRVQRLLSKMPGVPWAEREKLAGDCVAGLERLTGEFPREHRPRTELCEAQTWWGNFLRTIGRPADTEAAYQRVIEIADRLVKDFPSVPYYQYLQFTGRCWLGQHMASIDRLSDAEQLLAQAVSQFENVRTGILSQAEHSDSARVAYFWLGWTYAQTGRFGEADQAYRRAMTLALNELREVQNPVSYLLFHNAYYFLGRDRLRAGQPDEGVKAIRDGVTELEQLADAHPTKPVIRGFQASSINSLGYFFWLLGRFEDAENAQLHGQKILAELDSKNPGDAWYRNNWARLQTDRAAMRVANGQIDEAITLCRQRIEWLSQRVPDVSVRQEAVANSRLDLGEMLERMGRPAEQEYKCAIDDLDKLANDVPTEPRHNHSRAAARMSLARVLQRAGRVEEANKTADHAVAIRREAVKSGTSFDRRRLAFGLSDQGMLRWQTGRTHEALTALNEAVNLLTGMIATESETSAENRTLAVVHLRRARVLENTGRVADAEKEYTQAAELRRRVKDDMPTVFAYHHAPNPVSGRDAWAYSLAELGAFHLRQGQAAQAARLYAQARDVYEDTAASFPGNGNALDRLAWFLVTCPVESLRDPPRAIRLAKKATALSLLESGLVATLGAAQYGMGDYRAAVGSLELVPRLPNGTLDPSDLFFLAMARWQLGDKESARRDYDDAVRLLAWHSDSWFEFEVIRKEAAAVLGIK